MAEKPFHHHHPLPGSWRPGLQHKHRDISSSRPLLESSHCPQQGQSTGAPMEGVLSTFRISESSHPAWTILIVPRGTGSSSAPCQALGQGLASCSHLASEGSRFFYQSLLDPNLILLYLSRSGASSSERPVAPSFLPLLPARAPKGSLRPASFSSSERWVLPGCAHTLCAVWIDPISGGL